MSQQFRRMAQFTMRTKHRYIEFKNLYPNTRFEEYEQFLVNYGKELKGFSINALATHGHIKEWRILKILIETFTYDSSLEELELENFYGLSITVLNLLAPIISKLRKLALVKSAIPITIPSILKTWPNIKELSIRYCHMAEGRIQPSARISSEYPLKSLSDFHTKVSII